MSYKVYLIEQQCKSKNKPVKIGYSQNPDGRLKHLQTGNPYKLKLCMCIPFDTKKEAAMFERTMHHLANKKCKSMEGEWFVVYMSWHKLIGEALKVHDGNINKL